MTLSNLNGVIAAVPTPVTASREPDLDRFVRHAAWALENGCNGVNVLGTTGEANCFSASQRQTIMSFAASELDPSRMMVGTGTPDLATTIELTRFAHSCGIAAALILPPYYYKNISDEGLFSWFSVVLNETAKSPIPVYIYNFPQLTGIQFSASLVRALYEAFPDRIRGAKDSSGDLDYAASLARIEGFDVFPSSETALARAHDDGFRGCISATVNVSARAAAALWKNQKDAALLQRVSDSRKVMTKTALVATVKYLVARIHEDYEFERVLPPHLPLDAAERQALSEFSLG